MGAGAKVLSVLLLICCGGVFTWTARSCAGAYQAAAPQLAAMQHVATLLRTRFADPTARVNEGAMQRGGRTTHTLTVTFTSTRFGAMPPATQPAAAREVAVYARSILPPTLPADRICVVFLRRATVGIAEAHSGQRRCFAIADLD